MIGHDVTPSKAPASPIEREQRALWLWLRALGADAEEADDLTQEAMIIWARKGGLEWPGAQSGVFLRKSAGNLLKARRRKDARRHVILREGAAAEIWARLLPADDPAPALLALGECLEGLEPKARAAVEGFYFEGWSAQAVGDELACDARAVHQLLYRARQALKQCIEGKLSNEAHHAE